MKSVIRTLNEAINELEQLNKVWLESPDSKMAHRQREQIKKDLKEHKIAKAIILIILLPKTTPVKEITE